MYVLLTGPPKIGKSTIIESFIEGMDPDHLSGIRTAEVTDESGKRVGFKTISYPNLTERTIAHKVCIDSEIKVGSYKVNVNAIGDAFEEGSRVKSQIFLLDEIGRMQSRSDIFMNGAKKLFKEKPDCFILGTIVQDDELFARYFKYMKNVLVITVNESNRGMLTNFLLLMRHKTKDFSYDEQIAFVEKAEPLIRQGQISSAMSYMHIIKSPRY
jgi:nucleoside-triphosphatase THEP1